MNAPSGVLTDSQVNAYKQQVSEQVGLYQQVQEMSPIVRSLNLDECNHLGKTLYSRASEPTTRGNRHLRRICRTNGNHARYSKSTGLGRIAKWSSGSRECQYLCRTTRRTTETVRTLGKLRAEAEALGGTLRLPEYPLTAEKIAGVEAQMPSVRVEADVREQVSLAKSIGWDLEMPEPPYTLEMVKISEVEWLSNKDLNRLVKMIGVLKHPRLPMTQGDVETFKAAVNQQATWDQEIEALYNKAQASNKPKPPYTEQEINNISTGYKRHTLSSTEH